jgi:DNA-damage-inducible protein D
MATGVNLTPQYRHVMHRLESAKRKRSGQDEYWLAREIAPLLGYQIWANFTPVLDKAIASIDANGGDSSHHIARTSKLMGVGKGAQRRVEEFFLSRGACYLIAMNGDPAKPAIAAAQAYFAGQTRVAELMAKAAHDRQRLEERQKVTLGLKRIGDIAKDVGVTRYALFHDARHRGLYGMGAKGIAQYKGLRDGEGILERAAALELSTHSFQTYLAAEKILNEGITGEENAIKANFEVAQHVRKVVIGQAGKAPEDLPVEPDTIQDVKRRVKEVRRLSLGEP